MHSKNFTQQKNNLEDPLTIGSKVYSSRLFLGTGKYASTNHMLKAVAASKTQLLTMALRRIDVNTPKDNFMEAISNLPIDFLPNTSGARTSEEAVRVATLSHEALGNKLIKLELTPEPKHLLPDPIETLRAAEILVKRGMEVYPYINADPVLAKHLEEAGCVCVMPLGSPIGSNAGIKTIDQILIIVDNANIPVIVDAGIGMPSHASLAMEMGADAVLVNTAIATAKNPEMAAHAFYHAVIAGRKGFLAQMAAPKLFNNIHDIRGEYASPSSPINEMLSKLDSSPEKLDNSSKK